MLTESCPVVSPSSHLSLQLLVVRVRAFLLHLLRTGFCMSSSKPLLQDDLTAPMHITLRMEGHLAGWTLCLAGIPASSIPCSFLPHSSWKAQAGSLGSNSVTAFITIFGYLREGLGSSQRSHHQGAHGQWYRFSISLPWCPSHLNDFKFTGEAAPLYLGHCRGEITWPEALWILSSHKAVSRIASWFSLPTQLALPTKQFLELPLECVGWLWHLPLWSELATYLWSPGKKENPSLSQKAEQKLLLLWVSPPCLWLFFVCHLTLISGMGKHKHLPSHVLACHPLDRHRSWAPFLSYPRWAPGSTVTQNITPFLLGILSGDEQKQMQGWQQPELKLPIQSAWHKPPTKRVGKTGWASQKMQQGLVQGTQQEVDFKWTVALSPDGGLYFSISSKSQIQNQQQVLRTQPKCAQPFRVPRGCFHTHFPRPLDPRHGVSSTPNLVHLLIHPYLIPLLQFRVLAVGGALLLDQLHKRLQAGLQEDFAAGQFPWIAQCWRGTRASMQGLLWGS